MIKLSIIVPVYNVKPYLRRCLESLLKQSEKEIEIILINDGSTDGSEKICKEYAQKDNRIRFFSKENGGLSSARNAGLEQTRGEYVCFVDSDDMVADSFAAEIIRKTEKIKPDILYFGLEVRDQQMNRLRSAVPNSCRLELPDIESRINFLNKEFCTKWTNHVCDKCYRTKILKEHHIYFEANTKVFAEDLCFNLYCFPYVSSLACINEVLYYYIYRSDSIMGKNRSNTDFRLSKMTDLLETVQGHYSLYMPEQVSDYNFSVLCGMVLHKLTADWKKHTLPQDACQAYEKPFFRNNAAYLLEKKKEVKKTLGYKMGTYIFLEAFLFLNRNWKGKFVGQIWDALIGTKRFLIGNKEL